MAYADETYYTVDYGGTSIPPDDIKRALELASMHIDSLTYNRIVGRGFFNLTPFQQKTIKKVCCLQADFETENEEMINSVLKNYAINGTSMSFGESWNMQVENGIAMRRDVYALLCQTGLCSGRIW